MTWHCANKEMPPRDIPVLLAWWNRDNKYNKECVAIVTTNFDSSEWIESTVFGGGRSFNVDICDQWAYIELPE